MYGLRDGFKCVGFADVSCPWSYRTLILKSEVSKKYLNKLLIVTKIRFQGIPITTNSPNHANPKQMNEF